MCRCVLLKLMLLKHTPAVNTLERTFATIHLCQGVPNGMPHPKQRLRCAHLGTVPEYLSFHTIKIAVVIFA